MRASSASAPTVQTSTLSQSYLLVSHRHPPDRIIDLSRIMQLLVQSQVPSSPQTTSSPVSGLPVELLRDIFSYTSPTDQREIMTLMSVCSTWRTTVLGITGLFTFADWDAWPVALMREWCLRAGQTGLEVEMNQEGICRALDDDDYARLLNDTQHQWHQLILEFDRSDEDGNAGDVHALLSRWRFPQLRTLVLSELDHEGQNDIFILPDDFAPHLEELILKDAHVIRATPWENLKRVSVNVDFWARGEDGEDVFRTISRTEKLIFHGCSFSGIGDSRIVLEGVKHLVVVDDSIIGFAEWPLRHLSFPQTTKLVLCGMRPFATDFPDQDKVLWNNAFPNVTSLTLQLLYPWFHMVLPLLSRSTGYGETVWFPTLTTLSLLAHDWEGTPPCLPRAPQQIEAALISFLGTRTKPHHDASRMRSLVLGGITISEDSEKRLRRMIEDVAVRVRAILEPGPSP